MAIAFGGVTNGTSGMTSPSVSGTDKIAVVHVHTYHSATHSVTGITWGGVAMTKLAHIGGAAFQKRCEIWYLVAPADGTATVTVTYAGVSYLTAVTAAFYTGVHQSAPWGTAVGAVGNAAAPSVVVSSATDELVIDSVVYDLNPVNGTASEGPGQTARWEHSPGSQSIRNRGSTEPGAASVTMSWTLYISGRDYALLAAPLKPAAGGGGGSFQPGWAARSNILLPNAA